MSPLLNTATKVLVCLMVILGKRTSLRLPSHVISPTTQGRAAVQKNGRILLANPSHRF